MRNNPGMQKKKRNGRNTGRPNLDARTTMHGL
jgi:hypothetical protein